MIQELVTKDPVTVASVVLLYAIGVMLFGVVLRNNERLREDAVSGLLASVWVLCLVFVPLGKLLRILRIRK